MKYSNSENLNIAKSKNFSLRNSSAIKDLSLPLENKLRTVGFTYHRIFRNGQRIFLSSCDKWIEYFFSKKFYLTSSYKKYKQLEPFTLWKYWPKDDPSLNEFIRDVKEEFNLGNGLVINHIKEEYIDSFTLRARPEDNAVNNRYLNDIQAIDRYMEYFTIKIATILQAAENSVFYVPEEEVLLIPGLQGKVKSFSSLSEDINSKCMYYIAKDKEYFLSKRETDCVCLLAKGLSNKEIARYLILSPRTVETYINQIKVKLHCEKKSDIVTILSRQKWNLYIMSSI